MATIRTLLSNVFLYGTLDEEQRLLFEFSSPFFLKKIKVEVVVEEKWTSFDAKYDYGFLS